MTMSRGSCLLLLAITIAATIRTTTSFQPSVLPDSFLRTNNRVTARRHDINAKFVAVLRNNIRQDPLIQRKGTNSNNEENQNQYDVFVDMQRRKIWTKALVQMASVAVAVTALIGLARPVYANNNQRSRTSGYPIQKSEQEWKDFLSPMQYYILREGGTERPGYSILEKEKRTGTFQCAGCGTPLFQSKDKFNSGTGWPSFARGLAGVEVEQINPLLQLTGAGAELRCRTCGGHLGDVFNDGYLFIGTEAALTGQRYCIDGAALNFYPDDDNKSSNAESSSSSSLLVRGDIPASKSPQSLSSLFDPPVIQPRD